MRKLTLPALAALALAGALTAAELKLPPEVKGDPGDFVTVPADTSGKDVKWVALDAGLKVFPSALLKDSKTAVVTAQKPGKYRLLAYTADEKGPSEPAITTVVIAGVDPTPPAPPPGPPTPPVPPASPLTKAIQAAYDADLSPDKARSLEALAALYGQGGSAARSEAVKTWGGLFEVMATAAKTLGVSGKLPGVQKVIRDELVKTVPTETDKPLTQDDRNTAAVVFESVQRAIQGVKP